MTLPRVQRIKRDGVVRYRYHRTTGAKLPDLDEAHPDFLRAWALEEAKGSREPRRTHGKGTIGHAAELFMDGEGRDRASASYEAMLTRHLNAIVATYGEAGIGTLRAKHIEGDVANLTGSVALHRHKAWRALTRWAKRQRLIETDPGRATERPGPVKTDGHVAWTRDDVERARERWKIGTRSRAVLELLFWTAARAGDAAGLTYGMVARDGILTYRQSKTRAPAHVPWCCPLPAYADDAMARDRGYLHASLSAIRDDAQMLIIPQREGTRRSDKGMSNAAAKLARGAGLTGRTAHGLRKARMVALADARATAHEIMAWSGHETLTEVEHYTRAADRRRAVTSVNSADLAVKRLPK